jgi:NTE family protein
MDLLKVFDRKPYKTGLALSGGGVKGLCHAGALKALEEAGIKPDIISGVSSGALVGALYSDGYTPEEIALCFEEINFRNMTKIRLPNGGFFKTDVFQHFLLKKLRARTFEDLSIPLRVTATDLDKGRSMTFKSGQLIDPIVASCCFPVLFSPKIINGVHYVDGGVLKNFPVSPIRNECESVIGINASPLVADEYKQSIINVAMRSYNFMFKANIFHDKELCDLLIEPIDMGNYDTFDIEKGHEIFELGYRSTKEIIAAKLTGKLVTKFA